MRILFVINNFSYGGAEKLVFDLARSLCPRCEQVSVAALYRMNNETEARIQKHLESEGVKTYILDKKAGTDKLSTVRKLCAIVKADNIQLIHAHCSVPMYLSKLAGLLAGVKVVCTVHSTRGYKPLLEKLTGWMVHAYVSIGQAAEDYMLHDLGMNPDKITRIYNAVDTDKFQSGERSANFWAAWGLDDNIPVVISVGRVIPLKNQICLLRAVSQCRLKGHPMQCVILGSFEEASETYQTLQEYIQSNSLEKYVRFLGQQDDVHKFLQNSDCFVMTSHYEGLSVAYLEAVLCGIPVVTTDLSFVRELQQFGDSSVMIPQNDAEALTDILLNQRYTPASRETIAIFREKFSMTQFSNAHLELFNQLVGNKKRHCC